MLSLNFFIFFLWKRIFMYVLGLDWRLMKINSIIGPNWYKFVFAEIILFYWKFELSLTESHYNQESGDNQLQDECQGSRCDIDGDGCWSQHQQMLNSLNHEHQLQQQQQHSQTYDYEYSNQQPAQERSVTPEILSNKSSKEIYKDLAKQWGITCKMSDTCRCMECQGHYFDCEYDDVSVHRIPWSSTLTLLLLQFLI